MYIEARGITKSYGRRDVLRDVSFGLSAGRVMAMAGANGAGKTTLLKILSLVSGPDSGELLMDGQNALSRPAALRSRLAYVPQSSCAMTELTVYDNLKYWMGRTGDLDGAARALGLENYLYTRAGALSGGYLRRLDLAIAQINSPELLIMDEPLNGVDIDTRLKFAGWIGSLRQKGVTVIYTTHHTDEIENVADCMSIVYRTGFKYIDDIDGLYLDNLISRFINL